MRWILIVGFVLVVVLSGCTDSRTPQINTTVSVDNNIATDINSLEAAFIYGILGDAIDSNLNAILADSVPWQDVNVADDITLTNITQITNRSYSDLQNLPNIPTDASIDANVNQIIASRVPWQDVNVANNITIQTTKDLNILGGADLNIDTGRICNDANCYYLNDLNAGGISGIVQVNQGGTGNTNYTLTDSGSVLSVDWENRSLVDDLGGEALNYFDRTFVTSAGNTVGTWEDQELDDTGGIPSIFWNTRTLNDLSGDVSVNYATRKLFHDITESGGAYSVDWNKNLLNGNWTTLGDMNANRLCIDGNCISAWSQVGGGGGSGYWTQSGTSIYYNDGNVGIGDTTPEARLKITGSGAGAAETVKVTDSGGTYRMGILDDGRTGFNYDPTSMSTAAGDTFYFQTNDLNGLTTATGTQFNSRVTKAGNTNVYGTKFTLTSTASSGTQTNLTGLYSDLSLQHSSFASSNATGIIGITRLRAPFTQLSTHTYTGLFGRISNEHSTTLNGTLIGLRGQVSSSVEPTFGANSEVDALRTDASFATADVPNYYGARINAPTFSAGGSGGTAYALYLENMDFNTNYGVYSLGGTNYFDGNTGIGTNNPKNKLNIIGDINFVGTQGVTSYGVYMATDGNFTPTTDGLQELGSSTNRWQNIWATNGTIQTSDENLKKNIQPLSNKALAIIELLEPITYKWKDRIIYDTIWEDVNTLTEEAWDENRLIKEVVYDENTGEIVKPAIYEIIHHPEVWEIKKTDVGVEMRTIIDDKTHIGLSAQNVKDTLEAKGFDTTKVSIFEDKDGYVGLRYNEFIPILVKAVQEQQEEINTMKTEMCAFKNTFSWC